MNYLELEDEVGKIARAISSRDTRIGKALIANLKAQLPLEEVAGIILISLERLLWSDTDLFDWAVETLIPVDVLQEIRSIIGIISYKRLIDQGFTPGQDFSVGCEGKLLLSSLAQAVVSP